MRPEDEAANSEFEAILRVGEINSNSVHRIRLEQNIPTINLNDYMAIIAGGSPFDVSMQKEKKGQIQLDIETFFHNLFNRIVPIDFPFLGCCSGNGLLGQYCGVKISTKYPEPIGSVEISVTNEGSKDPLLKGLPLRFSALVGHKEACEDIPEGAVLLGTSKPCPVQMFRLKKNIYATQFHPEADANEFILRIKTYNNHGYFAPEEAQDLITKVSRTNTPVPKEILKRFVRKYTSHSIS
ncbi:glutamine amidotransferase [Maribacter sp. HTCC2170]|nr:glutamine amidotransferase [Maribacter sp. HTCC2170]